MRFPHRNWPNPVMLCDRQEPGSGYSSCQAQWDPRVNVRDRAHKMPIITPAFPCQNSTVSCGTATLLAMKEEFERGDDICKQILASGGRVKWSKLWEPSDFFLNYRNLIVIRAFAPNQDALTAYAGLVQACVKKFVENIPEHALGVPYPKVGPARPRPRDRAATTLPACALESHDVLDIRPCVMCHGAPLSYSGCESRA